LMEKSYMRKVFNSLRLVTHCAGGFLGWFNATQWCLLYRRVI
jgi:hypothetical protein